MAQASSSSFFHLASNPVAPRVVLCLILLFSAAGAEAGRHGGFDSLVNENGAAAVLPATATAATADSAGSVQATATTTEDGSPVEAAAAAAAAAAAEEVRRALSHVPAKGFAVFRQLLDERYDEIASALVAPLLAGQPITLLVPTDECFHPSVLSKFEATIAATAAMAATAAAREGRGLSEAAKNERPMGHEDDVDEEDKASDVAASGDEAGRGDVAGSRGVADFLSAHLMAGAHCHDAMRAASGSWKMPMLHGGSTTARFDQDHAFPGAPARNYGKVRVCSREGSVYLPIMAATLADSFLADLDDLSDNEEAPQEPDAGEGVEEGSDGEEEEGETMDLKTFNHDDVDAVVLIFFHSPALLSLYFQLLQEPGAGGGADEGSDEEEEEETMDLEALNYDDLDAVAKLQKSARYIDMMRVGGGVEDNYRLKFPELESLVLHPIDYARVVRRIGNEMDLTVVDLEGLLPSATIMVVSVTASTTTGRPLPDDALQRTMEACDRALALDDAKKKVLRFVESRMGGLAPNLSAVVGSAIAAQLVGVAGGLMALASMPACNIQVLGSKRKTLSGFSTATSLPHTGFLFHCEVVQATPPPLRMRATRLVAGKCALAARVDATHGDLSGGAGRGLRAEMERKIDKWQEPPPAKQPKPLPVPDAEPKKRRGGRRLRKMKERYGITDMRKLANRMQFGVEEQSTLGDGLGEGYGMLGQAGSGRLRVAAAASNLKTKVAKKFKERSYGSSGNTSGLSSSLAFTPIQGIELTNPQAAQMSHLGSGTQSTYFSETGTFSKIKKP
ncbi:unnamed protein product [Closterium sp. Yama58-4]|nr:unnamed protein product [Closterium sp. Yama58-4]